MVEVTAEDWDAAQVYADLYSGSECYKPSYHQRIGEAFARHRIAAEQRGKLEALEAAADRAYAKCAETWHVTLGDACRQSILALSTTKIVMERRCASLGNNLGKV